jgi:hypothetical protein
MKKVPTKYRTEYTENRWFKPFSDFLGYHDKRIVEMTFLSWGNGYCFDIEILDVIFPKAKPPKETSICKLPTIYDHPISEDYWVKPTMEEATIIAALATDGVRGVTAENMAYALYYNLLINNPKSGICDYLPKVCENIKQLK